MTLSIENAARTWDVLADRLETFIGHWEAGGAPPTLADHLPDGSESLRRLTLIELVKIDLEYRRQTGAPLKRIESYLAEHPLLAVEGRLPTDLIYEEFHVRKTAGEAVEPAEYFERFPDQADELRKLMGMETPQQTTSLGRGSRKIDLEPGQSIDDFDLLIKLGKGAFASVFLARQRSMQRLVALKVSADRGTEPQTLAQLDNPFIVRVYDQRQLREQKLRLLYMQYVAGGTLQGVVERVRATPMHERTGRLLLEAVDAAVESGGQTPLSDSGRRRRIAGLSWPDVVCMLGAQLAAALDYAHRKGVLHRDIKPANVLLAADLTPKLADFNISFSSQLDGAAPAAYFGGSLAYMSPEQLEACNPAADRQPEELDGRSDLYSLGVLLWELLLGTRPFVDEKLSGRWSDTLEEMAYRRRLGPPGGAAAGSAEGDCELQLQRVLARCLASEPADRYATGEEMCRELLLCREPHTRRLLSAPRQGWREAARRFPFFAIILTALVPNAIASVFNYIYNDREIVKQLSRSDYPRAQEIFWNMVLVINGLAFPLGVMVAGWLAWQVARGVAGKPSGDAADPESWAATRRRALLLGHYAAWVGIVEWSVAGLAFPVCLQFLSGLPPPAYFQFMVSMVLCGLIAGAYPFFGITYLAVRVFYPALVKHSPATEDDQLVLARVSRLAGRYLLVAGGVPLLGVASLAIGTVLIGFVSETPAPPDAVNAVALVIVSVVGVLGFLAAYGIYAVLQRDMAALSKAAAPADPFGTTTDSIGLF